MKRILQVEPYPVYCGGEPAAALARVWNGSWSRAVLIADENTYRLFGASVEQALVGLCGAPLLLVVPPGEATKSREKKAWIEDAMLAEGIDRSACIVALGGGIVLDLAGFVAATYMRGIAHINIATTLLAIIDAAIGGKTAINTPAGKNLVGAFHQPRAVLLNTDALSSLPDRELLGGMAEAIKHAMLRDRTLFEQLETWAKACDRPIPNKATIERCVQIKAEVVADDERDTGLRNILNYGHTVAHAIEHATKLDTPHGHAVAIGMVVEARLATHAGAFPKADLKRLKALLDRLTLPTEPTCSFEAAKRFFFRDKKTKAGTIRCAIPSCIGTIEAESDGAYLRKVDLGQIERAWSAE